MSTVYDPTKRFSIADYLTTLAARKAREDKHSAFKTLAKSVKSHIENRQMSLNADEFLQLQHNAIIGKRSAIETFKAMILDFLRKNSLENIDFPSYYPNLTEAIFQEVYGLGPFSHWFTLKDNQSAEINGTAILYQKGGGKEEQPFRFESIQAVNKLINHLLMRNAENQINELSPFEELEMENGTRVTIWVPPVVPEPIVVFRKFPFKDFSFEAEAKHQTIEYSPEAIAWFKLLAEPLLNVAITGQRNSGKTTLTKVWYAYRPKQYQMGTVEIKTKEIRLEEDFPDRKSLIKPIVLNKRHLDNAMKGLLRSDCKWLLFPEIREDEANLAFEIADDGFPIMFTFHSTDTLNLPATIARRILKGFPQYSFFSEFMRVAGRMHIVIRMEEDVHTGAKIVYAMDAIELNERTNEVIIYPWVRYDEDLKIWQYQDDYIPPFIERKMKQDLRERYQEFLRLFRSLAEKHPLHLEPMKPDINAFTRKEA